MNTTVATLSTPFQPIKGAVKITGMSEHYIRHGVADGSIAHIRSGAKIMINVPALLQRLDAESRGLGR
jgi:hypothetical protein